MFTDALVKSFSRIRHSRGFGVHSPFAYKFVIDVLRPGYYGYYSYWEIEHYLNQEERRNYKFINLIKFVIRLSLFLKCKRIVYSDSYSRLVVIVSKVMNLKSYRIGNNDFNEFLSGDLLITSQSELKVEIIENALESYVTVFAINPGSEERNLLENPIKRGLLLNGKKKIILIPRKEMEYVAYDMNLDVCVR